MRKKLIKIQVNLHNYTVFLLSCKRYLSEHYRNVVVTLQMQSCKQTLALLKQDKEYLNKQLTEVTTKYKVFEEQVTVLNQELGKIKKDREELYEKYISVRY